MGAGLPPPLLPVAVRLSRPSGRERRRGWATPGRVTRLRGRSGQPGSAGSEGRSSTRRGATRATSWGMSKDSRRPKQKRSGALSKGSLGLDRLLEAAGGVPEFEAADRRGLEPGGDQGGERSNSGRRRGSRRADPLGRRPIGRPRRAGRPGGRAGGRRRPRRRGSRARPSRRSWTRPCRTGRGRGRGGPTGQRSSASGPAVLPAGVGEDQERRPGSPRVSSTAGIVQVVAGVEGQEVADDAAGGLGRRRASARTRSGGSGRPRRAGRGRSACQARARRCPGGRVGFRGRSRPRPIAREWRVALSAGRGTRSGVGRLDLGVDGDLGGRVVGPAREEVVAEHPVEGLAVVLEVVVGAGVLVDVGPEVGLRGRRAR